MCGRFSLFARQNDVETRFGARFVGEYAPHYNAAPGQELAVVPDAAPETIRTATWGLVPPWAEDREEGGHINARAETAAEKPSFRDAFRGATEGGVSEGAGGGDGIVDGGANGDRNANADGDGGGWDGRSAGRCLVPADGFYEWGDAGDGRRPYRLEVGDRDLFAMAGLWTRWVPSQRQAGLGEFDGERAEPTARYTFAILTTDANDVVAPIHDRMPVILAEADESRWLAGDVADPDGLLGPYDGDMRAYAVSSEVNDATNDVPAVVEPLEG